MHETTSMIILMFYPSDLFLVSLFLGKNWIKRKTKNRKHPIKKYHAQVLHSRVTGILVHLATSWRICSKKFNCHLELLKALYVWPWRLFFRTARQHHLLFCNVYHHQSYQTPSNCWQLWLLWTKIPNRAHLPN